MALSPNYGWAEPDNSSLVKNGAQDIRALGDAIDTSVWNVGYGQAGKNKIINGDFGIWQRGTTQSVIDGTPVYGSTDRWAFGRNGTGGTGTNTVTRETHTVGQTDVPNNPTYYCRWTATTLGTGQTRSDFNQYIEDVSEFAAQTCTLSFWVKSSGVFAISTFFEQNFGSGGSAAVTTTTGTGNTSTSWTRFTTTVSLPSITGKTVGTSNYLRVLIRFNNPTAGATFDVSNVQLEYGSKASPFQTASGGSPQSELAMCQRYYYRQTSGAAFGIFGSGISYSTTGAMLMSTFPVQMRITPASVEYSTISVSDNKFYGAAITSAVLQSATTPYVGVIDATVASGLTANAPVFLRANNSSSAYIAYSSEL
jgi:hypothetical protein